VCVCDLGEDVGKWGGQEGRPLPLCAFPDPLIADRKVGQTLQIKWKALRALLGALHLVYYRTVYFHMDKVCVRVCLLVCLFVCRFLCNHAAVRMFVQQATRNDKNKRRAACSSCFVSTGIVWDRRRF